ncbi:MAG TPA: hypothetical protein VLB80_04900 [Candidatus Babeliales bacterium]|nr:hypothetical protein [Candidatus Babeliales bacterium]
MFTIFQHIAPIYQGLLYCITGIIMLLYALGIISQGITTIVILFAIFLIAIGSIKMGLYPKLTKILNEPPKHHRKE